MKRPVFKKVIGLGKGHRVKLLHCSTVGTITKRRGRVTDVKWDLPDGKERTHNTNFLERVYKRKRGDAKHE